MTRRGCAQADAFSERVVAIARRVVRHHADDGCARFHPRARDWRCLDEGRILDSHRRTQRFATPTRRHRRLHRVLASRRGSRDDRITATGRCPLQCRAMRCRGGFRSGSILLQLGCQGTLRRPLASGRLFIRPSFGGGGDVTLRRRRDRRKDGQRVRGFHWRLQRDRGRLSNLLSSDRSATRVPEDEGPCQKRQNDHQQYQGNVDPWKPAGPALTLWPRFDGRRASPHARRPRRREGSRGGRLWQRLDERGRIETQTRKPARTTTAILGPVPVGRMACIAVFGHSFPLVGRLRRARLRHGNEIRDEDQ